MMWLNGELVKNGTLNAASAGVLSGWGVFTTLGVRAGKPRFLRRHFERLRRDANEAAIANDLDFVAIERAVTTLIRAGALQNGLLRLTLTARGDRRWNAANGADFSVLGAANPAIADAIAPPLRVQLSPYRIEARRPLRGVKTTSYLPYLWAWREAKSRGFDEAILRESGDFLCEGARSSLFWTRDGVVFTPELETGCLRGIGRELLLEWAQQSGHELQEGRFESREAESAAEIWLVSAATGPRRIAQWHDENGAARAAWNEGESGTEIGEKIGADFALWFTAQDE